MSGTLGLIAGWQLTWGTALWLLGAVLAVVTVPSVLRQRQGRPLSAIAWLFALISLPYLGVIGWWAIGRRRMRRWRRRRSVAKATMVQAMVGLGERSPLAGPAAGAPLLDPNRLPGEHLGNVFPMSEGNRVHVLVDAERAYPSLEAAVRDARHHVHFLFYIWGADETGRRFRDLLADRARAGIEVRVLVDALGGADVQGAFMQPLRDAGARVATFLPLRLLARRLTLNFRNHRKIVVVDGRVAFIGGLNIGDEYTRDWHDVGFRLEGPVVEQLQEVFAEDWYFASGENLADPAYFGHAAPDVPAAGPPSRCQVIASGPDTRHNASHGAFFAVITGARRRLLITTPYFIPDSAIQTALRSASYRGVDVRLLIPARSDVRLVDLASRSYYRDLLAAGVRIWRYENGLLHSKLIVADDEHSLVGSANLDIRSLQLNFESNCYLHSPAVAAELSALFEQDLRGSTELTVADLDRRSRWQELVESLAHLLSPLL